MSQMSPHGGTLVSRIANGAEREKLQEKVGGLVRVQLNGRQVSDLELIATGGFSPIEGFMNRADYESVVKQMRLQNELPWTIPITLAVNREEADALREGTDIALADQEGIVLGVLHLEEKFRYSKQDEAIYVYKTEDPAHPGVAYLCRSGDVLLGGKVTILHQPKHRDFGYYRLYPSDMRKIFQERGWRRIVAFQTRNPIHRAHEYIQKCALEIVDGLLIHPLVGETKADDIPAWVRMKSYEVIIAEYYPQDRTLLGVFPAAMRYAGPREAVFHAIVRKNYGCTHFIVGRDHAGVGNYYGTFDAHYIFEEFEQSEIGITPMFFDYTFYCTRCGNMASPKTCPHGDDDHLSLSGTKVREMLEAGLAPPPELTRPEVAHVLVEGLSKRH